MEIFTEAQTQQNYLWYALDIEGMKIERLGAGAMGAEVGGIDEAGRGPVLGPMVVAGIAAQRAVMRAIRPHDSKTLTPGQREHLFDEILRHCGVVVCYIEPSEIDIAVDRGALNDLEAKAFAIVASELMVERVLADAVDVDERRFSRTISEMCGKEVIAEHGADARYPEVGAASIVAKVLRDRAIRRIEADCGCEIGSGYPSDPKTVSFLRQYVLSTGHLPPFARVSWATSKRILKEAENATLDRL